MQKRRVTLNLDEDVVEALEALWGPSMSAVANEALRQAVAAEAHRAAVIRWMDELDARYGKATLTEEARIDALLAELAATDG